MNPARVRCRHDFYDGFARQQELLLLPYRLILSIKSTSYSSSSSLRSIHRGIPSVSEAPMLMQTQANLLYHEYIIALTLYYRTVVRLNTPIERKVYVLPKHFLLKMEEIAFLFLFSLILLRYCISLLVLFISELT